MRSCRIWEAHKELCKEESTEMMSRGVVVECRSAGRRNGRSPDEHEDTDLFPKYRQEDRETPDNIQYKNNIDRQGQTEGDGTKYTEESN